ncbi:hypothetical protein [Mycolicibacterium lutetiense]
MLSFILWVPIAVGAAFWGHSMQTHNPSPWLGIATIVGSFLPAILASIVADEARDTFGQRRTGNWIALIPALSGVAVGSLGAAVWIRDFTGGMLALVSVVCSAGAATATLAAWRGVRYTRRRQDWLVALRRHGARSPGVLRRVEFRQRWTGDDVLIELDPANPPKFDRDPSGRYRKPSGN